MATRVSPTSHLLRKSRLFALPPTLSSPAQASTSGVVYESPTATLPHPVRPAIVTPTSSLARGDWGLKRPLPAKSTTHSSSTPVVRINRLDTHEHVTDFESAADHALTLRKWQELSLPISKPSRTGISIRMGGGRHESVFESTLDNTAESSNLENPDTHRYRFKGPWLAGQTQPDFDSYMKNIRKQKPELLNQLRKLIADQNLAEKRRKALDEGKDLDRVQQDLSEAEFTSALRALRADPGSLGPLIYELLDLAPPPRVPTDRLRSNNWGHRPSNVSSVEYADQGPPATHPSAGLSYLRTNSHIDNHPVVGPQAQRKPAHARILRPKKRSKGLSLRALAGVGGIVTEDINAHAFREHNAPEGITEMNPDVPGGAKYWVRPIRASVTSEGKISLAIDRATDSAKAIHGVLPPGEPLPDVVRGKDRRFGVTASRSPPRRTSSLRTPQEDKDVPSPNQETKDFLEILKRRSAAMNGANKQ